MTHKEIIQATWPDHAQRILEAIYGGNLSHPDEFVNRSKECYSPEGILFCGFRWSDTPEGHVYWFNLAERAPNVLETSPT